VSETLSATTSDAEPFHHPGGAHANVGVLLCHGFTGSPQSLRPWGESLAKAGFRVSLPRLPGHGTHWKDLQATGWPDWLAELEKSLLELRSECDHVFVMGLSMGGGLALRLAELHGPATDGLLIDGLVLVNPSVKRNRPVEAVIPLAARLLPSVPGIASDIKKDGASEIGYDRVPLKAARSLAQLWKIVQGDLGRVTQPVLLFRSVQDHVVHPSSSALVLARIASTDVAEVLLPDSYHVATLDHDADRIFEGSVAFVRRLAVPTGQEAGA
jgi:carboxylesterase